MYLNIILDPSNSSLRRSYINYIIIILLYTSRYPILEV